MSYQPNDPSRNLIMKWLSTRKLLERVPEDKWSFQPHQKSMPLGRLAGHIATLPRVVGFGDAPVIASMPIPPRRPPLAVYQAKEMLSRVDQLVAEDRELISQASDEQTHPAMDFSACKARRCSKGRALAMLRGMFMSHVIHHRGQLGVYLRLNDVPIPGMYGPSADEM